MNSNRRSFLVSGAAVLPTLASSNLAVVSQPGASPVSSDNRLKLGTVTYNIAKTWDIDTIIKNLKETGFQGVELRTEHAHGVEPSLTAEKRAEVKRKFADSPIQIAGLGTTCEYHSPDPQLLSGQIQKTMEWIKLAKDVGCGNVKVRPNGLPKAVPEEKTLQQIGNSLRTVASFAGDHGVRIQLEVHGAETSRFPRIHKILEYAQKHPSLWICWNSNQNDLLDDGFDKNYQSVKDRIGQIHMRDLFLTEYPWKKLIQNLKADSFQGFCLAEIPDSPDPLRLLHYYKALFLAYQDV